MARKTLATATFGFLKRGLKKALTLATEGFLRKDPTEQNPNTPQPFVKPGGRGVRSRKERLRREQEIIEINNAALLMTMTEVI